MRYIFILLFLSLGLSALAQQNIVESLQRNRAGEGTVTIRQDPKITGLIGSIYTGNVTGGEQKMLKAEGIGFRSMQETIRGWLVMKLIMWLPR